MILILEKNTGKASLHCNNDFIIIQTFHHMGPHLTQVWDMNGMNK